MLKFRTTEEISGIKFLDPIRDSTNAVGELFNKFSNNWKKTNYKTIMLAMFRAIKQATILNVTFAKSKLEEADKLKILGEVYDDIAEVEDLFHLYLDEPYMDIVEIDSKTVTLEEIKNVHERLLETLDILERLTRFEIKTLKKLNR